MNFILQDWAGNVLTDFTGKAVDFETFDDGWDYIHENYEEEDYEELLIVEKIVTGE